MDLNKQFAIRNDCFKAGQKIKPQGIMWHSTGANNPNLRRYVGPDDGKLGVNRFKNYWNRSGLKKCCHAFIGKLKNGDIATYQILPWDYYGWHCGKGKKGSANATHIGFEICEDDKKDKSYAMSAYKEAIELTACLCKLYSLDPFGKLKNGLPVITDHAEAARLGYASNHGDVLHWFGRYGITLDKIRQDVAALLASGSSGAAEPEILYRVMVGTEFKLAGSYRNKKYAEAELQRQIELGEAAKIVEVRR
jgi:N-acetylmuramoyl-L-alanine amidase